LSATAADTGRRRAIKRLSVHEPADGPHQFVNLLLGVAGRLALPLHAVSGVSVEKAESDLVKRCLGGADLGEDVDAVAVVLHHAGDAADLTLDSRETLEHLVLAGGVAAGHRLVDWVGNVTTLDSIPYGGIVDKP
jgi:hypothetical protein